MPLAFQGVILGSASGVVRMVTAASQPRRSRAEAQLLRFAGAAAADPGAAAPAAAGTAAASKLEWIFLGRESYSRSRPVQIPMQV